MDFTTAGSSVAFIIVHSYTLKEEKEDGLREYFNGIRYGNNLMSDILLNDGNSFRNFVGPTKSNFEELLCLVAPKITKNI